MGSGTDGRGGDADVLIIGAGAAGLAAARSLAGQSLRVTILEARDRVGGRAWSKFSAPAAGQVEFGAEFIHGRAEETMTLLREAGIQAVSTQRESWTCAKDGGLLQDSDDFFSTFQLFEDVRTLTRDESVDCFLRRFDTDPAMQEKVRDARAFVEGFDAADPAIASVRAIANELGSGTDSASARPIGGYQPMFEHLRETCTAEFCFSTVVQRISWRRGSVSVVAKTQGAVRTFRARAIIVTLPVGVLRHAGDETAIIFEPELPAAKRNALRNIEMGHAVKVGLQFRTAFWERIHDGRYRDAAFFRCEGQPFAAYWTQLPMRSNLIVAWAGGPRAIALSGYSQAELIERALSGFGTLLGESELSRKEFEGGVMHDWDRDPFARGAYSYIVVGGDNARAELAASLDGTVFFAGEATSGDDQGGTVNGALETGKRAAREVATSLGAKVK